METQRSPNNTQAEPVLILGKQLRRSQLLELSEYRQRKVNTKYKLI